MGIPEEPLITEKVAIWEGMFVAEQNNDSIGVSILQLHFGDCCGNVAN